MTLPAPPVFLVGAARSGTSLLYKSLCLHPEAAWVSNWVRRFPGLPGLAVLNRLADRLPVAQQAVWFGGGSNAYVYGVRRSALTRAFPMPVEGEPFFARCGVPGMGDGSTLPAPAQAAALRAAVAAVVGASGGRVFVSKRIGHNWRIPYLLECFPDARFVEIVRDGRAVAYSLSRVDWWEDAVLAWMPGTPRYWHDAGIDPWELCALNWVAELDAVATGMEAVPPRQRLRLSYERFLASPIETVSEVARFAGLSATESWGLRLLGLRVPDRNDAWRSALGVDALRTIEAIQAEHLRANGYARV